MSFASTTPSARACENVIARSRSAIVRDLDRAERAFDVGRPEEAVRITSRLDFGRDAAERGASLVFRFMGIRSVADVRVRARSGPAVDASGESSGIAERSSLHSLHALVVQQSSPKYRQWEAEAQVQVPAARDEGVATLEALASSDLMVDAYGYAALARAVPVERAEAYRLACVARARRAATRICPAARALTTPQ